MKFTQLFLYLSATIPSCMLSPNHLSKTGMREHVRDTLIDGINYQRYKMVQIFHGNRIQTERLFRCDQKGTRFNLGQQLSDQVGCPLVKAITLTPDGLFVESSGEIEFVSRSFPDSVRRVFKAWKQNVTDHPVE